MKWGKNRVNYNKYSNEIRDEYTKYFRFTNKSWKGYLSDRAKTGKVTSNFNKWKKNPRKWDYLGIDTPKFIFRYKKKNEKTKYYKY